MMLLAMICAAAASLFVPQHASAASPSYYVASMDMTIDAGSQNFIQSSLGDARASGAVLIFA